MKEKSTITEHTMIPIGWAITSIMFMCGAVASGAYWVSTVNTRLAGIEKKLGITRSDSTLIDSAEAKEITKFLGNDSKINKRK